MRILVIFTAAFAAACLLCAYLFSPVIAAISAAVFAAAAVMPALIKGLKHRKALFLLLSGLAFGFLYFSVYSAVLVSPAEGLCGENQGIEITVCSYPEESYSGFRYDGRISCPGPDIRCILYNESSGLLPGDVVSVTADVQSAEKSKYSSGVYLTVYASKAEVLSGGNLNLTGIGSVMASRVKQIIFSVFPEDTSAFAEALITGDKSELSGEARLYSALKTSGLAHIVAVSGMHLSFLISVLSIFVKNRRRRAVSGILLILFFMVFTGFSPSVCRAGIMYIFVLCADFTRREADPLTSLFAALLLLLLVNPYSCAGVSLQLSFLSSLGIILMSGRIYRTLARPFSKLGKISGRIILPIISILSVTAAALLFTVPVTALYFGSISLCAPLASLLVMGVMSAAFILCACACALGFIWLPAASLAAHAASLILRYISKAAIFTAGLPFSAAYTSNKWVIVWLVCTYVIVLSVIIVRLPLRRCILPACISAAALCAAVILPVLFSGGAALTMTALDVGQGQCIVITSSDFTAVVDCGSSSGENAGSIAVSYLLGRGIDNIDILILTHYHADHINGTDELLSAVGASTVILPPPEDSTQRDDELIELAGEVGSRVIFSDEFLSVNMGDSVLSIYPPIAGKSENERCTAILCSENDFDILITGDMPAYCEMQLIDAWPLPDIEVLVAGHHGSATSTSEQLLQAVKPETAVISVGENSYGHPSPELLTRLSEYGAAVFRTDISGDITISAAS